MATIEEEARKAARRVPVSAPVVQPAATAMAAPAAPAVSPAAAAINQQIRRPGGISPIAAEVNQQVRAAAPAPVVQPAATAMATPPATGPAVSPAAAQINQQIQRPGGVSRAADVVNQQLRAPGPSVPPPTPAYRTGAPTGQPQFAQTPTPVNPNPRAALAQAPVPATAAPVPAAAAPAAPVAQVGAAQRAGQVAGAVQRGAGAAARLGAAPVATAGPGIVPGLEKTAPGQRGGTGAVLATMAIPSALTSMNRSTSEYENRLGLDDGSIGLGVPYQAAARGEQRLADAAGLAPDNALRNLASVPRETAVRGVGVLQDLGAGILDTGLDIANMVRGVAGAQPLESFASLNGIKPVGAPAGAAAEALPANAGASPVPSAATALAAAPAAAGRQAIMVDPDNPATQPPARAGGGDVIGQFNGRNITRAQADQIGSRLGRADSNQSQTGQVTTENLPASPAAQQMARLAGRMSAGAQGAVIRAESDDAQIDRAIADLGPLNMRSKRSAVVELLGLKQRGREGAANRDAAATNQANELAQRSAAQMLAGEVDLAQTEAQQRTQRRQNTQTITGADGTVYSVNGNTLQPLTTSDGQPFRTATKLDDTQQKIAAGLLESLIPPGATPDQVNQAVNTANTAAKRLASGETAAPPSRAEWLKQAKAANKGVSEEQLTAYYDQTYGTGK